MRCDALLLAMRYGYAILQAVLVWFLRFMRFGEHPYARGYTLVFLNRYILSLLKRIVELTLILYERMK